MRKKTILLSLVLLIGLGVLIMSVNNAKAGIIECALAMDEACKSSDKVCYFTLKATGEKCIIAESDFGKLSEEEGDITD